MDYVYCNGFDQRVAEQRLSKQTAIEGKLCFYAVRTEKKHVVRQCSGKHASTTMGDGVFRGISAKELP
jgi:hypothetical protein